MCFSNIFTIKKHSNYYFSFNDYFFVSKRFVLFLFTTSMLVKFTVIITKKLNEVMEFFNSVKSVNWNKRFSEFQKAN